jgi:hypothetical protein
MFNQKYIILFIDRGRMQLFGGNLTGIVTIEIPPAIFSDLDVIRRDDLYTLIKQCVKQYNLTGSSLIMVLSEATYFEKLFPPGDNSEIDSTILKFFDTVPYEAVWTRVYQTEKGKRAIAINKSLYEAFHQGFTLQGLSTKALLPSCVLGQMSVKRTLDKQLADYIVNSIDSLAKQSLLDESEASQSSVPGEIELPASKKKSNVPLLLGVFGVLLIILIVVVLTQLL